MRFEQAELERRVVGVPVASLEAQTSLQPLADAVFSLYIPGQFRSVGSYYRAFGQVRDDDGVRLLGGPARLTATGDRHGPCGASGWTTADSALG